MPERHPIPLQLRVWYCFESVGLPRTEIGNRLPALSTPAALQTQAGSVRRISEGLVELASLLAKS